MPNQSDSQLRAIRFFATAGILLGVTLAGCGGETRVPVYPVSGKVSVGGKAPAGAQVVLHPKGHTLPENVAARGTVKEDGTYRIGVYAADDGAPAGEYVATVTWFKLLEGEGGGGRGPNVLPREYASPESSPVKVTVRQGPNEVSPIEIR